jgi:hypothetical protein
MATQPDLIGKYTFSFTTDKGFDLFIDEDATEYAVREYGIGSPLTGWKVILICKDGKPEERVLFNDKGEPVWSGTSLEALSIHIDMRRKLAE